MIHLDTNMLVELSQQRSDFGSSISRKITEGGSLSCCSIAWSEFSNGPITPEQVSNVLDLICSRVTPFDRHDGELAAKLFNFGGRRRGSGSDCMIAAAAIRAKATLATHNRKDFSRFESQGLQIEPLN